MAQKKKPKKSTSPVYDKLPPEAIPEKGLGRPSSYRKEYCQQLIDYYQSTADKGEFPQLTGFSRSINVVVSTVDKWISENKDFSGAYQSAKRIQKSCLCNNALTGKFHAGFTQFLLINNHDMIMSKTENKDTVTLRASIEQSAENDKAYKLRFAAGDGNGSANKG